MDRSGGRDRHHCRSCSRVQLSSLQVFVLLLTAAAMLCGMGSETRRAGADTVPARFQVTLVADGTTRAVTTGSYSVAELLASEQIELGAQDRVQPALEETLGPGAVVRVQRVVRRTICEDQVIAASHHQRLDPRVAGKLVLDSGEPGLRRVTWEVWEVDGEEVSRTVLSSVVVRRPRAGVAISGGRKSLPSRGGTPMIMESTGYDPGPRSCGKYASGRTAIGMRATRGVAAVDPRIIPLGTRLYVEGYGLAVAADVGSAIKGRRIDLCFDSYRQALQWGRRTVKVFVVE